ncbi:hypothetical protein FH972_017740 [Carpinus fangiana]|uniref:Uncharacterized protein n=1 Tax=Carpinus fangiana TaxID=176857 RepID=A0A5N6RN88_9ROSI|nr:hypothetical protein FH972_017740 [Carpinus fangiana]
MVTHTKDSKAKNQWLGFVETASVSMNLTAASRSQFADSISRIINFTTLRMDLSAWWSNWTKWVTLSRVSRRLSNIDKDPLELSLFSKELLNATASLRWFLSETMSESFSSTSASSFWR